MPETYGLGSFPLRHFEEVHESAEATGTSSASTDIIACTEGALGSVKRQKKRSNSTILIFRVQITAALH